MDDSTESAKSATRKSSRVSKTRRKSAPKPGKSNQPGASSAPERPITAAETPKTADPTPTELECRISELKRLAGGDFDELFERLQAVEQYIRADHAIQASFRYSETREDRFERIAWWTFRDAALEKIGRIKNNYVSHV